MNEQPYKHYSIRWEEEVNALRDEIRKLQLDKLSYDWVKADAQAKELLDLLATERDRFGKLETEMKKELAEKDAEIGKWKKEAMQQYPTPEAYDAVCEALKAERAAAEKLVEAVDKLKTILSGDDPDIRLQAKNFSEFKLNATFKMIDDCLTAYRNRHKGEQSGEGDK